MSALKQARKALLRLLILILQGKPLLLVKRLQLKVLLNYVKKLEQKEHCLLRLAYLRTAHLCARRSQGKFAVD